MSILTRIISIRMSKPSFPIYSQAKLGTYTTFRLGGACKGLVLCETPEQLEEAVRYFLKLKEKFILIGGGSNLVVSDQGVDCYVIRFFSEHPFFRRDGNDLIVSGSTILDDAVEFAVTESLEGINYGSGIPGTVGGAVVGNAGAWG